MLSTGDSKEAKFSANKWDVGSLKLALDDASKEVMRYCIVISKLIKEKFDLVENHGLLDGRLILCTISVLICGYAVLWDYLYPHPRSRTVLIVCVILYFILSGLITFYVMYIEKNVFFVGLSVDKTGIDPADKWQLSSIMNKYDSIYRLTLSISNGTTKQTKSSSLEKCASQFFDRNGNLQLELYHNSLLNVVSNLLTEKKMK